MEGMHISWFFNPTEWEEIDYIKNFHEINDKDIIFLKKYYPEELELEIKKNEKI